MSATERAAPSPFPLRSPRRPLSDDIRDVIAREFIENGRVAPGELLPSEHSLSKQFRVSRVTVRAAVHSLREAGLVVVRQGRGATVLPRSPAVVHGLDRLGSIDTFARESGHKVDDDEVTMLETVASSETAERLLVPEGHPVFSISRTKVIDGVRAGWAVDHVPAGFVPFSTLSSEYAGSALDVLLQQEIGIAYADAEHTPVALSPEIAHHLGIADGAVAMFIDTVVWTADSRPVAWAQVWLLPEHFRFMVRRRRAPGQ